MLQSNSRKWIAAALLATTSLLAIVPAASADRGKHRRYKGDRPSVRTVYQPVQTQRVYARHSSGAAPVIAGIIGGFILGTAVSHASDRSYAPAPVRSYVYYDPYYQRSFASLDECNGFHRAHRYRPRVIRVIEVSSGECVRTLQYREGDWYDRDDRYGDDDRGGYGYGR